MDEKIGIYDFNAIEKKWQQNWEAGKTFKVLLIKTTLTKPYTSVFFQLECGYWNAEAEKSLRDAMK